MKRHSGTAVGIIFFVLFAFSVCPWHLNVAMGAEKFKAAILLPGKINDRGWNMQGHKGVMMIKEQLGAEVAYSEDVVPADQAEAFRDYASRGFNLVLGMGGQYTDGALKVADQFPKVLFGVIGSNKGNGKNMASFNARQEQNFYQAGVVCGLVSKTKKVAYISGNKVDNVIRGWMGFQQGVLAVAPKAKVQDVWTGDFEDVAKAKEAALALIDQGYDVIQSNSNASTFGAMEAAQAKGVYGVGCFGDYTFVAPKAVITNVVPYMYQIIFNAGKIAKSGKWEGKFFLFTFADFDIGGFTPMNSQILGKEKAAMLEKTVAEYKQKIKTGKIVVKGPN